MSFEGQFGIGVFMLLVWAGIASLMIHSFRERPDDIPFKGKVGLLLGFLLAVFLANFWMVTLLTHGTLDVNQHENPASTNELWVVVDTMLKGALLDLVESFQIQLADRRPKDELVLIYRLSEFIFRTTYSFVFAGIGYVVWSHLFRSKP